MFDVCSLVVAPMDQTDNALSGVTIGAFPFLHRSGNDSKQRMNLRHGELAPLSVGRWTARAQFTKQVPPFMRKLPGCDFNSGS
jgi:hypothetical protein